ncbi:NADH-cytochrome b5 reductase 1-like [Pyrus communis]|uniref:NADH-cytochrome b5 reductase 1-like n=1 Tax=Pyrus communis TaxID=23211 RepID=UPI0035C1C667
MASTIKNRGIFWAELTEKGQMWVAPTEKMRFLEALGRTRFLALIPWQKQGVVRLECWEAFSILERVKMMGEAFQNYHWSWVLRSANMAADALMSRDCAELCDVVWVVRPPSSLWEISKASGQQHLCFASSNGYLLPKARQGGADRLQQLVSRSIEVQLPHSLRSSRSRLRRNLLSLLPFLAGFALNPDKWVEFKLQDTARVSHNTQLFRFTFDPNAKLGIYVASCLLTRAPLEQDAEGKPKYVIRPYTPISDPDAKGYFDLLIKVYPEGKMSQHFASLKPGDIVEMKGPIEKLRYTPNMKKHIGMIAGGTGITPMLQVIEAILKNPDDTTQVRDSLYH